MVAGTERVALRYVMAVVGFAAMAWAPLLSAAPQAELWPRWTEHDEQSNARVDHAAWADFLDAYLVTDTASGINLVRYADVTSAAASRLAEYVNMLEAVGVSKLSRAEQFAYWINLYNAFTVQLIVESYPIDSIREIGGLFNRGPWDRKELTVEEQSLSLNDIEHRILRPIWNDPRIHYAVNCAAMGCPNLQPQPFTAESSERLLNSAAREYVNHRRGARKEGATLVLSSIYDWYQADFGGTVSGVIAHLRSYAGAELASQLGSYAEIRYEYDWSLNDAGER